MSYQDFGIVRRAFIGTVLSPLPEATRYTVFIVITLAAILLIFITASVLAVRDNNSLLRYSLFLFAISPLGAMNFGWMFGRFEFINYLILLACVLLSYKKKYAYISVLLVSGILVHEAFVMYGTPFIAAAIWASTENRGTASSRLLMVGKIFLLPLLTTIFLAVYGNSNANALGANRNIFDKIVITLEWSMLIITYLTSIFLLHLSIYKSAKSKIDPYFCAPYFTLILFALGIDYYRWLTILFFMVGVSLFTKTLTDDGFKTAKVATNKSILICSFILAIPFFGPIGVCRVPFPAVKNLLTLLDKI